MAQQRPRQLPAIQTPDGTPESKWHQLVNLLAQWKAIIDPRLGSGSTATGTSGFSGTVGDATHVGRVTFQDGLAKMASNVAITFPAVTTFTYQAVTTDTTLSAPTTDLRVEVTSVPSTGLTVTLPAANGVSAGIRVTLADAVGTEPTTFYLSLLCAGSDVIVGDGSSGARWSLQNGWASLTVESDGTSKWVVVAQDGIVCMDPRSAGTVWGWWDASRGTTGNITQITAWTDQGSGGNNLANANTNGPSLVSGSDIGRAGISFWGGTQNNGMTKGSVSWAANNATIFIVAKRSWNTVPSGPRAECLFALATNGSTATTGISVQSLSANATYTAVGTVLANDIQWSGAGTNIARTPSVVSMHSLGQFQTPATSNVFAVPQDFTVEVLSSNLGNVTQTPSIGGAGLAGGGTGLRNGGAFTAGNITNVTGQLSIGCLDSSATNSLAGIIYEVVVFQSSLSAANQLSVISALTRKYRIKGQ